MNVTLKKLGLAAVVAASFLVPAAYAAGFFPDFPVVGSAAFCASTNSQSASNTVPGTLPAGNCTNTVPAGPTALTGAETYFAQTNLANGVAPQNVNIPSVMVASGAYQYAAPLTGTSVAALPTASNLILDPAGTIATLTITLPAASSLIDGQTLRISSSATVTALTLTPGSGTTISNAPTAITISTTVAYGYEFVYRAANTKWYRLN